MSDMDFAKLAREITKGEKYYPVLHAASEEEALYRLAQVTHHRQQIDRSLDRNAARAIERKEIASLYLANNHNNPQLLRWLGIDLPNAPAAVAPQAVFMRPGW